MFQNDDSPSSDIITIIVVAVVCGKSRAEQSI